MTCAIDPSEHIQSTRGHTTPTSAGKSHERFPAHVRAAYPVASAALPGEPASALLRRLPGSPTLTDGNAPPRRDAPLSALLRRLRRLPWPEQDAAALWSRLAANWPAVPREDGIRAFVRPRVRDLVPAASPEPVLRGSVVTVSSPGPGVFTGQNCSILMIDITGFNQGCRTDIDRLDLRDVIYRGLRAGFERAGMPWADCHVEDRGDGALVVVPPHIPTRLLLRPLADLAEIVHRHNLDALPGGRLTVRAALNVGPVVADAQGLVGGEINGTARLLDARVLKRRLAESGGAVGVIVSRFVYDTAVRPLPSFCAFYPVRFQVKETRATGWVAFL
ncbi:hypothetical protein [Actinocorallia herbida]|uniref:hypothetical protein n=1 Tax=Actinocorallia herbida TaxID=58109 RepID=UPI0011CDDF26|nr:hypothetical protein [Actinocorallia herbida]